MRVAVMGRFKIFLAVLFLIFILSGAAQGVPMKIAIIGNAGSGKSTLAIKLHEKLGFPLYHVDKYQWAPGWQRVNPAIVEKKHTELCNQEAWIIDGLGVKFFKHRIEKADIVVFLDMPTSMCLWRVIKRSLFNWGKVVPGSPEGCEQRVLSMRFVEFLQWIYNFNKKYRKQILNMLDDAKDKKKVFIITNQQQIDELLNLLLL